MVGQQLIESGVNKHNKIVGNLALLKVIWDSEISLIDIYIPFLATLIYKNKYTTIETQKIIDDFNEEYGIAIPHHPMITILDHARQKDLIRKSPDGMVFYPVKEKVLEYEFTSISEDTVTKKEILVNDLIKFVKENYDNELSNEDALKCILIVLKEYDLEIIGKKKYDINSDKKSEFFVHKYIEHIFLNDKEKYNYFVDLAIGNVLVNSLFFDEISNSSSKLNGCKYYLDTPFIIRLLGLEGEYREESYKFLVQELQKNGGKCYMFQHSYNELMDILSDCERWVNNEKFDPSKASPILIYFIEKNFTKSDVRLIIANVDNKLSNLSIKIVDLPLVPTEYIYQISEEKLFDVIVNIYKKRNNFFVLSEKEDSIWKDVKSISIAYRKRKNKRPKYIEKAAEIFVTTNASLSYAAKLYDIEVNKVTNIIPVCLTDTLIGTYLWLFSPVKSTKMIEDKIIADCYAALKPDEILLKKFTNEVDKLKSTGNISADDSYILKSHPVAWKLLEEKTMGDVNNFHDRTVEEILEEIKNEYLKKEREEIEEDKKEINETKEELNNYRQKFKTAESRKEKIVGRVTDILYKISLTCTITIFIVSLVVQLFGDMLTFSTMSKVILLIPIIIFGVLSILTGWNIKGFRFILKDFIKRVVENIYNELANYFIGK